MTDRTLAEAMGMNPQETAELREKAERLATRGTDEKSDTPPSEFLEDEVAEYCAEPELIAICEAIERGEPIIVADVVRAVLMVMERDNLPTAEQAQAARSWGYDL
jgi:hypothetical protein